MDVEHAIRTRRTHKAYAPEPVDRDTLEALLDLARWAPNHHLTNPWRFRVIGPQTLARLKQAAGDEAAAKLDRAPTLVAVTTLRDEDPDVAREDRDATAVAAYIVLLGAHAPRASPATGARRASCAHRRVARALRLPDDEDTVGLLHLGTPRQEQRVPERAPAADVVTWLD